MSSHGIQIAAIILAAGASNRLGHAKQMIRYHGSTLLERSINAVAAAIDGPILIVSGSLWKEIDELAARHTLRDRIQVVQCTNWQEGMGTSLACGVNQLTAEQPTLDAILVSVCDQPHLDAAVLKRLLALQARSPLETVACAYNHTVGPPACFAKADFKALRQLRGERGAKSLLNARRDQMKTIPFEGGAFDIDTPEDYLSLLNKPQAIF